MQQEAPADLTEVPKKYKKVMDELLKFKKSTRISRVKERLSHSFRLRKSTKYRVGKQESHIKTHDNEEITKAARKKAQ